MELGLKYKALNAIDFLIENQDQETDSKLEAAIHKIAKTLRYKKSTQPLTEQDLKDRALIAEDNYAKGKYRSQK